MKKITFVFGGIRSGKSVFAEQKALYYSEKPVYLATAISCNCDQEMKDRIACHQDRREENFETIEAPYDITGPLSRFKDCTVLVDCLTLNLSNRLGATEEYLDLDELIESDAEYLEDIYNIIVKNNLNVIFVSNEVGMAPVEMNKLGRFFQDIQGRWNRTIAEYADEVYFVRAGIATDIKNETHFPFKISAPSYVLPTGYIENVTYLIDKVKDIQLLAFDSLPDDPLFKLETISTLDYLAKEPGISYSVHMPVQPKPFAGYEKKLESAFAIIGNLKSLNISSYTFHYDLPDDKEWKNLSKKEIKEIDDAYIHFFKALKQSFPETDFSLENTATPLSALDKVIKTCGISYAIDIGHLLVQGWDLSEVKLRLENASIVHLHGWEEKDGTRQDHRPIVYNREVFQLLEDYKGVLTIENYHKLLFEKSLSILKEYY
jgi:adenosylcobinamide kinase / adenosylcobinamide-phosphate guanylyltransferase